MSQSRCRGQILSLINIPVSILYKSTAGRYRPVSYPDGPITARYRFIKNAYWDLPGHNEVYERRLRRPAPSWTSFQGWPLQLIQHIVDIACVPLKPASPASSSPLHLKLTTWNFNVWVPNSSFIFQFRVDKRFICNLLSFSRCKREVSTEKSKDFTSR